MSYVYWAITGQYSIINDPITGFVNTSRFTTLQGSTAAFLADHASHSIDAAYLDGISITVGTPHKHKWSYAAGFSKEYNSNTNKINCPCAKHPGVNPPIFV